MEFTRPIFMVKEILRHFRHRILCRVDGKCRKYGEISCTPKSNVNVMVTPCINNIQHFNFQMTHTTFKNVELLKHFKISKTAPTCFGLQGNHLQRAIVST